MIRAVHYVGFKPDQHYANAVAVFGPPDFIHPGWDKRAWREIADDDIVLFAKGPHDQAPRAMSYNDPGQE